MSFIFSLRFDLTGIQEFFARLRVEFLASYKQDKHRIIHSLIILIRLLGFRVHKFSFIDDSHRTIGIIFDFIIDRIWLFLRPSCLVMSSIFFFIISEIFYLLSDKFLSGLNLESISCPRKFVES